jgi:ribosomal protein S18 acetylase RimI-like enzyme
VSFVEKFLFGFGLSELGMEMLVVQPASFVAEQLEQLRAIYLDSFPSYERADFSFLVESIAAGERWLFTATRDDSLLGFAILVPRIARDIHLLEYLAVARDARGAGIGGRLLDDVRAAIRDAQSARGILLEVEHDAEGVADERALRARRLAFYLRHGARVIDDAPNYRVPLTDRAGTLRMKLLWLPVATNADAPRGEALRACVAGIFSKSYGVNAADALAREILVGGK